VADSAELQNDFPVEASIPDGGVTLDSILCTEELRRRPCRPPDYQKENRALVALASALLDSQSNILQTLAETACASAMKGTGQIWRNTANGIARAQSLAT